MTEVIKVSGLNKNFGDLKVIEDISFTVEKGQIVSIIGPSGSGKTTLLRCLNGLEIQESGTIVVNGENITSRKIDFNRFRENTGFVFQGFNLFTNKTVLENLITAPVIRKKWSKQKALEKAGKLLERMDLKDKENEYPKNLSGGQQQRVAIARALAMEPQVLLLDEPTSALDPELSSVLAGFLKELASEGTTMLVVTHDMKFAKEISDSVIFIEGGRIVEEGSPEEIFDNPKDIRTARFLEKA